MSLVLFSTNMHGDSDCMHDDDTWQDNIDSRKHVLDLYHDAADLLVERALSTDDIETEFSLIVHRYLNT